MHSCKKNLYAASLKPESLGSIPNLEITVSAAFRFNLETRTRKRF